MKMNKERFALNRLERILDFLAKCKQLEKFNSVYNLLVSNGYTIILVDNHYKISK